MKEHFNACSWSNQARVLSSSASRSQPAEELAQLSGTVFDSRSLCPGDGVAFVHLLHNAPARRYGIEIDAYRAEQARTLEIETLQANTMDVRCPADSLSLLYLNPPYDWEAGSSNNQRLEAVFLDHTYRWLKPGRVLLFVIPLPRLAKCARLLSEEFEDLRVFRLTEPACLQFKQIVVLGTRRKRHARLADSALLERVRCLEGLTLEPDLEPLAESAEWRYIVPGSGPLVMTHLCIPLDEVEDLQLDSVAYHFSCLWDPYSSLSVRRGAAKTVACLLRSDRLSTVLISNPKGGKQYARNKYAHPMKEDVKEKNFSPPLREMRVW